MTAVSVALLSVVSSVLEVVLLQLALGFGSGVIWPITDALVLELDVPIPREKVLGRYSASWGASPLIGPLVGGSIVSRGEEVAVHLAGGLALAIPAPPAGCP